MHAGTPDILSTLENKNMESAEKIISSLEEKYPQSDPIDIQNWVDNNLNLNVGFYNQFILGLTVSDPMQVGMAHYESRMRSALPPSLRDYAAFSPWSFRSDEVDDAKQVFGEIAGYYSIDVDVEKTFERLGIKKDSYYFIVVTIVRIPVIHLIQ